MGRDASHSNSLFQAAETVVRRLCELHSKVGSIEFLLPRPSSPPSLHDARSIFHFLLVHVMDNCCYIGLILISLEREMEGGGINLCNNIKQISRKKGKLIGLLSPVSRSPNSFS